MSVDVPHLDGPTSKDELTAVDAEAQRPGRMHDGSETGDATLQAPARSDRRSFVRRGSAATPLPTWLVAPMADM
jgi:hypothetical protein